MSSFTPITKNILVIAGDVSGDIHAAGLIRALKEADPDVRVYTCSIDRCLNEDAYILPGLGDAGDRIFGTL